MDNASQHNKERGITLLGLGPGSSGLITRQAWDWLNTIDQLYLRTLKHPVVENLPEHLDLLSFDGYYERYDDFEKVYEAIVEKILNLGSKYMVTYAVPGHPFVAEATSSEIMKLAKPAGIPVFVIDGLSFLEPTFHALNIDPLSNLVITDAIEISKRQVVVFSPSMPTLIAQIYDRFMAAEVKLTLMSAYPDEHPVRLVHAAGTAAQVVEELPLHAIDKSSHLGLLSSLFVPPLSKYASLEAFQEVIAQLRTPDGCPWDRKQTHLSLRPYLLEEAYETVDALDREDMDDLQEELGDLLLQIVLHAQIAIEDGDFTLQDVIEGIATKIVRRHPHIFSGAKVNGVEGVIHNWEQIKAQERNSNGSTIRKGLLDGVPNALPALLQAEKIIERVGRVGFDKLAQMGATEVVDKYLNIYQHAQDKATRTDALGRLLLAVSARAFKDEIDVEGALRETLTNFRASFGKMESIAVDRGKELIDLSAEELDRLWIFAESHDDKENS